MPTPIGNLGDITLRALEVLKNVDIVFSEDTRSTLKLFNHYNIKKPIKSFHKDNELKTIDTVLQYIKDGKSVAIVSEAGMPCISDPGSVLTNRLSEEKIDFQVLPGATALTVALLKSGFPTNNFYFKGFLSHKKNDKLNEIEYLKSINSTIIVYESPHRIKETLFLLFKNFDKICVLRELTKIYEEKIYINSEEDIENIILKGEFVIVIDNNYKEETETTKYNPLKLIEKLKQEKFSNKDILSLMKVLGFKRNEIYPLLTDFKE
ncbi:MAG: rRNA (cytidine1402-2-O)-methyltransferase [Deferribacteres bacterium]|nr:Ribosomal small subunit methyltransferase [Deferribacteraceae bacterium]MDK2792289.1 rRNA (cytidine1402-2-O)-methyltransferase [Deferribacteres bacterium]